jgi:hypothetical protein
MLKTPSTHNFFIKALGRKDRKTLKIEKRRIRISQIHMTITMILTGIWELKALQNLYNQKLN